MIKHFYYLFVFFVITFTFFSCPSVIFDNTPAPPLPQGVLLDISALNEMETPVTIKIRHQYRFFWYESADVLKNQTVHTEWSTEYLNGGADKKIGVEKTPQRDTKSSWEASGFILLNEGLGHYVDDGVQFESTFNMEIETTETTFSITGDMVTSGKEPDEMYLCKLYISGGLTGVGCQLYTYKQWIMPKGQFTSFILPVNLTIKPDGSWTFEYDDVKEGNGVTVWPFQ